SPPRGGCLVGAARTACGSHARIRALLTVCEVVSCYQRTITIALKNFFS
ncbi:hypothetical protein HMPREF1980_00610, partial [Actinomyces sp. oral taxon 172 str. F0311]